MKTAPGLSYTLFVPSNKLTTDMRGRLIQAARGATLTSNYGMWVAPSGELVGEPVTSITLIVQADYAQGLEPVLENIAAELRALGEVAVMYTVAPTTVRWKGDL